MKYVFNLLLVLILTSMQARAQRVNCSKLLQFVVNNGIYRSEVIPSSSSWLISAKSYEYNGIIYVIAKIIVNKNENIIKTYVYCGIPFDNWDNFDWEIVDPKLSASQKFCKYIMDYKCDCD